MPGHRRRTARTETARHLYSESTFSGTHRRVPRCPRSQQGHTERHRRCHLHRHQHAGSQWTRLRAHTRSTPIVVFTTAYSQYAVDGYKVNAIDYLLKPFGLDDFLRAANRVKKQFDLENTVSVSKADEDDAMFLKTEHKVVRINISDIQYIEGMSEYLKIHLDSQSKPIIILLSMKKLEDHLPDYFKRIHRSFIINLKKIREVNKSRVILDEDTYLPIGDLYRDDFNKYLEGKFLGK